MPGLSLRFGIWVALAALPFQTAIALPEQGKRNSPSNVCIQFHHVCKDMGLMGFIGVRSLSNRRPLGTFSKRCQVL